MTDKNAYRLIWFQHFHKAAGTSIVQSAVVNGEVLYPKQSNGNPKDEAGTLIPLENYNADQLNEFVDHCEKIGVTFVACEWDIVDYETLAKDPRVVLISCFRIPLERFLSNYYVDFYSGHINYENPKEFLDTGKAHTQNNYYCRILSRKQKLEALDENDFNGIVKLLSLFDYVCILENDPTFTQLYSFLGWTVPLDKPKNQTEFKLKNAIKYFLKGKSHLNKRRKDFPREKPSEAFQSFFSETNSWDEKLYQLLREELVSGVLPKKGI